MGEVCADRPQASVRLLAAVPPERCDTTGSVPVGREPLDRAGSVRPQPSDNESSVRPELAASPARQPRQDAEVEGRPALPDEILRFRRSERHLHWAIAVPFMVCYVTAAILILVYNPNPARPLRAVVSWIHRISGMSLAVLPALVILAHWRDVRVHLHNVRWGWKWTLEDVKWLLLMGPATFNKRIELPHQGKFNAGEKINFIAIMTTYPIYVTTGLLIWFAGVPFLTWLAHVYTAAFVATPLMLGHIFMALVNPDTRVGLSGMLSGFVDRHWARHHYRHWYDLTYGHAGRPIAAQKGELGGPFDSRVTTPALARGEQACLAEAPRPISRERRQVGQVGQVGRVGPSPRPWQRLPGQILAIEGEAGE